MIEIKVGVEFEELIEEEVELSIGQLVLEPYLLEGVDSLLVDFKGYECIDGGQAEMQAVKLVAVPGVEADVEHDTQLEVKLDAAGFRFFKEDGLLVQKLAHGRV